MLLDTNVISEMWRLKPNARVTDWLDRHPFSDLFLCTPVLAEIRFGIEKLPIGSRRTYLERVADQFLASTNRESVLQFDIGAAFIFGSICAHRERIGRRIELLDAMIAAIALANQMPLVTRNVEDFAEIGLTLIDPFAAAS